MNSTLICFLFPKFIYFTKIQLHKIIGKLMVHNKMNIDERYNRTGGIYRGLVIKYLAIDVMQATH